MKTYADSETQDEEIKVVAHASTRAKGYVAKIARGKLGTRAQGIALHQPDVAGIEEGSAMKTAENLSTQFHIRLQLEVARLVDVGILGVGRAI